MNKQKVLMATTNLKAFFEKEGLKVSEVKEVLFRVIDYVDERYDEEKFRDTLFVNGNGIEGNRKDYKERIPLKITGG